MSKVSVSSKNLSVLMLSAVRYALGRRTYIVSETVDIVKAHIDVLSSNDLTVMLRDIEETQRLGDACDQRDWLNLRDLLKARLTSKNEKP